MHIHFVCTGNVYRSRLAEAYLGAHRVSGITVSSSGTHAETEKVNNGPISWYAMRLIKNTGLITTMSWKQTQLTQEILEKADLVIFMEAEHFRYAKDALAVTPQVYEIWNVSDVDGNLIDESGKHTLELSIMDMTEKTFQTIQEKVNDLITRLPQFPR